MRILPLSVELEVTERKAVLMALAYYDGRIPETANALGISVRTLYYRLARWGLSPGGDEQGCLE